MASTIIAGQFYSKIISKQMNVTESQNEGGHSTAKNEVPQPNSQPKARIGSGISYYLPFARFVTNSACCSEKLPVDLDHDLQ